MPNRLYNKQVSPPMASNSQGPGPKAQGSTPKISESKTGPNRSGGDPTTGKRGPFYVKKSGI